jgi:hypothetical protein
MIATAGPKGPRRLSTWLERTDARVGVQGGSSEGGIRLTEYAHFVF